MKLCTKKNLKKVKLNANQRLRRQNVISIVNNNIVINFINNIIIIVSDKK